MRRYLAILKYLSNLFWYRLLTLLTFRRWCWFDDGTDVYKGKRVIIVGPAVSSLSYLSGAEIDSFDLVIRVNKSPHTIAGKEALIGARTDVLYHCCDEDPITGGGVIDVALLGKQSTKMVVYTYGEIAVAHNFYRCLFKYPELNFFRVHHKLYRDLKRTYKSRMPTTGLQALNHIMRSDFKELHITGFTFFKTAYADGYRDEYKSSSEAISLATGSGNHDPDDELRIFKEIYLSFKDSKCIYLDSALQQLMLC